MDKNEYKKYAKKTAAKSPVLKDCLIAFAVGGGICCIGQAFSSLYSYVGLGDDTVTTFVPITMIFLGGLFTVLGLYEKLAKYAGAGTIIPITGFANSIVSPAIEYKTEGLILGVGAKMFVIAGPVIVYGTLSSIVYGLLYYYFGGAV